MARPHSAAAETEQALYISCRTEAPTGFSLRSTAFKQEMMGLSPPLRGLYSIVKVASSVQHMKGESAALTEVAAARFSSFDPQQRLACRRTAGGRKQYFTGSAVVTERSRRVTPSSTQQAIFMPQLSMAVIMRGAAVA